MNLMNIYYSLSRKKGLFAPGDPMKHCETARGLVTGNLPIILSDYPRKRMESFDSA